MFFFGASHDDHHHQRREIAAPWGVMVLEEQFIQKCREAGGFSSHGSLDDGILDPFWGCIFDGFLIGLVLHNLGPEFLFNKMNYFISHGILWITPPCHPGQWK